MTRWNLSIPDETDRLVRSHLARNGMKKGDLSNFVEDAVRSAVLREAARELQTENPDASHAQLQQALQRLIAHKSLWETVDAVHERNQDADSATILSEIDEAVAWVRAHPS